MSCRHACFSRGTLGRARNFLNSIFFKIKLLSTIESVRDDRGGELWTFLLKPKAGLSGPPSALALHIFDSIPAHPMQTQTAGFSTPRTTALAVVCSGRNDRVGEGQKQITARL